MTEWRLPLDVSEVEVEGEQWGYLEYDRRGNLVVTGRFAAAGVESPMYVREYDDQNKPTKRTFYCDRTAEQPRGRPCLVFRGYRLDDHGNVAEESGYDLDGNFVARVSFLRDAAGRPLERRDFFGDDSKENRTFHYRYNEQGDVTETRTFDTEDNPLETRRTSYDYDTGGRIVGWITTDVGGDAIGRGRNRYDADGNRIESVSLDAADRPVRRARFTYEFWE